MGPSHTSVTALDVAKYILNKLGEMTAMKLQKLVYYSQAWSLVWNEMPLFNEPIEAWANGPVIRRLYEVHRGQFIVNESFFAGLGYIGNLSDRQKKTINSVLDFYGKKTAQWLIDLSHMEDPWRDARKEAGLKDGEKGWPIISNALMHEYYSGLLPK